MQWTPEVRRALIAITGMALVTAVFVLIVTAPFSLEGQRREAERSRPALPLFDSPVEAGLPPPGPSTRAPVNTIDRFTGEPITATSPTISYKGYTLAFCCARSRGLLSGWARLTEAEKDTYIRNFIK